MSPHIFPRKGFGYYLLATTCLCGSLAITGYGLFTVLNPWGAAAAITGSLAMMAGIFWDEHRPQKSDPDTAPSPRLNRLFNKLAKRAGLPKARLEMADRIGASCNLFGPAPLIKLGHSTAKQLSPHHIAAIIGHELGHAYYSPHLHTLSRGATASGLIGMIGLSASAAAAVLFGPTHGAPGFGQDLYNLFMTTSLGSILFSPMSRLIEKKCDQFSIGLTGSPEHLAWAIERNYTQLYTKSPLSPLLMDQCGNELPLARALSLLNSRPSVTARIKNAKDYGTRLCPQKMRSAREAMNRALKPSDA